MNLMRTNGKLAYNLKNIPSSGIVFLFCSWSESRLYLQYLISILNHFPTIDLFVIDIEDNIYLEFQKQYDIKSHGKGETYWLLNNQIKSMITDYKIHGTEVERNTEELLKHIQ